VLSGPSSWPVQSPLPSAVSERFFLTRTMDRRVIGAVATIVTLLGWYAHLPRWKTTIVPEASVLKDCFDCPDSDPPTAEGYCTCCGMCPQREPGWRQARCMCG